VKDMPVLEYYGDHWGYLVLTDEGSKVLCYHCFNEANQQGQVKKITRALGTEDMTQEGVPLRGQKNFLYVCDGCNGECIPEEG
jgi:hypothetical protein